MIIEFNEDSDEIVVYNNHNDENELIAVRRKEFDYPKVRNLIKFILENSIGYEKLGDTFVGVTLTRIDEGRRSIIEEY